MESCVANPVNTLIKLFVLPSNLISKRHDKLLDYDSAQSVYEKAKDQQARQVRHARILTSLDIQTNPFGSLGQASPRSGEEDVRSIEQSITGRTAHSL